MTSQLQQDCSIQKYFRHCLSEPKSVGRPHSKSLTIVYSAPNSSCGNRPKILDNARLKPTSMANMSLLKRSQKRNSGCQTGEHAKDICALPINEQSWYKNVGGVVESEGAKVLYLSTNASLNANGELSAGINRVPSVGNDARVSQYWEELLGYIRRRFGAGPPDPEEVVQTAFVKILSRGDIDEIENPRAFLYTTAYNTAIDMIRSQNRLNQYKRANIEGQDNFNGHDITPERVLLSKEDFRMALDTINGMPDIERNTLVLYRIHGLTLVEIAARLGKSKTSVIRYLASATRRLVDAARAFESGQVEGENS